MTKVILLFYLEKTFGGEKKMKKLALAGVFVAAVMLVGCGGDGSSTSASSGTANTNLSTVTLSKAEVDDVLFMREEEKLARDVYLTFYQKYNTDQNANVFNNIAQSEQNHMNAMANLIRVYNLTDPVVDNTVGKFTNQDLANLYTQLTTKGGTSLKDALYVGAYIEEIDIVDLKDAINLVKQNSNAQNIISTYENLMCGSRNHLRAFASQIKQLDGQYTAQVLSQQEVDSIINTPNEKCGTGY